MIQHPKTFLSENVLRVYNIDTLSGDKAALHDKLMDIAGDICLRIPPYYVALHSTSRCYLFDFQAVNAFPGAKHNYRKAHHGVHDLFIFNTAADLAPAEDQVDWRATAAHVQDSWIAFCYGDMPWAPFDKQQDGPLYVFADQGQSREVPDLSAAVGSNTAQRWKAVITQAKR